MTRRECKLKEDATKSIKGTVEALRTSLEEVKATLSGMKTWMDLHSTTHAARPTAWTKAQAVAVVGAILFSALSLLGSTILGILSIIRMNKL